MSIAVLWADTPWSDSLQALRHYHKLLVLPLLIIHFSRSQRGLWALWAYVASVLALLLYSWGSWFWPALSIGDRPPGVPVKDHIFQSMNFVLVGAILADVALTQLRARNLRAVGMCGLALLGIVFNLAFVSNARTALVVLPVLLFAVGCRQFGVRGGLVLVGIAVALYLSAWHSSPYFRTRVLQAWEWQQVAPEPSSEQLRVGFWRRSVQKVMEKPVLGHGTGSMQNLFAADAMNLPRVGSNNPHNQILAVSVQAGLLGALVLLFMWTAHAFAFRIGSWPGRWGLLVVLQNIVGSAFNSHLADATAGWLYIWAVGILAGTMARYRADSTELARGPSAS